MSLFFSAHIGRLNGQDLTYCYLHMTEHDLKVIDTIDSLEYISGEMSDDGETPRLSCTLSVTLFHRSRHPRAHGAPEPRRFRWCDALIACRFSH